MLKEILKKVHNLEDLLVECSEMAHFSDGISKLLKNKNEAYLKEKEAEKRAAADVLNCEMFRYLSTT